MIEVLEGSLLLDGIIRTVLKGGSVEGPPVDPFGLLETLAVNGGLTVEPHILDADKLHALIRFARLQDRAGPGENAELCRLLFNFLLRKRCSDPAERETWALWGARLLLMPDEWFRPRADEVGWDLLALHEMFSTAQPEHVAQRILDFKEGVMTVFDGGAARARTGSPGLVVEPGMNSLEAAVIRHVLKTEEFYQQAAEYNQQKFVMRGWPILERGRIYCIMLTLGEDDWPEKKRKKRPT